AVHPAMASGDDVSSYINANLKKLERFINREIRYRSSAGLIEPDQVTREEILDEAVATALGEDEEKPELLSLERWMYRLALQALEGFTLEEIAMTTDRPQEKVKASVQAAREHLRNALHVPAPVKERLLRAKIA